MRFKVLTVTGMKTVFWDVAPCSLVEINRCFRGVYCLHHQGSDGRNWPSFQRYLLPQSPVDGGSSHL
jgi:hypothetical protein